MASSARAPSVSATPPDPSPSAHVNRSGQDAHGITPSIISHSPSIISNNNEFTTCRKKMSASARDLLLGLTMTRTPLVTPTTRPATRSRAQNISPEHEPSHHRNVFTASRRCSKCPEVIKSPRSSVCFFFRSSLLHADLIHTQPSETFSPRLLNLSCASCNTNHCRGCFKLTRCPPNCSGGKSYTVRACCPSICAIALFEVLCSFDKEYAGFVAQNLPTGEFINVVIARTDKKTRAFEGTLVGTLRSVSKWLLLAVSLSASSESESGIHPSIPRRPWRRRLRCFVSGFPICCFSSFLGG